MVWYSSHYILLSGIALAVVLNLAIYTWRRHKTAIGRAFIVLMVAIAEWSLMTVFQLTTDNFSQQVFWYKLWFPGVVTVPVAWFIFILVYTGREHFATRRNILMLSIVPALTLIAVATDSFFHFMWREFIWDTQGAFPIAVGVPGFWFWVHSVYSYSLMLLSFVWLIKTYMDSSSIYRKQAGILLLGLLLPWGVNLIFVLGLGNETHVDPTPAAFAATGLIVFWGLVRLQLLDIIPITRDALIKRTGDGIIVIDIDKRIIDINPAVQRITGYHASQIIGKPLHEAFPGKDSDINYFISNLPFDSEIVFGNGDERNYYRIHASPLFERDKLRGQFIVLNDISEQKKAERRLQEFRPRQLRLSEEFFTDTIERRNFIKYMARELKRSFSELSMPFQEIMNSSPPERLIGPLKNLDCKIAELNEKTLEFLDFLQADSGGLELHPASFELAPLLKQASDNVAPLIKHKNCKLQIDLTAPLNHVFGDIEKTRQVTQNLLLAALHLIPPGEKIGLYAHEDGAYLWTEVQANGLVMTETEREQFFDPYAGQGNGNGTSIEWRVGLALSKRLVELSGGQIVIETRPERGTKISFSLPLSPTN